MLVTEILDQGIICFSEIPFSSHVLLVKKKDRHYRFLLWVSSSKCLNSQREISNTTTYKTFDDMGCEIIFTKLGVVGYYHRFIKGYATIASPLTVILQKYGFHCGKWESQAFEDLKWKLLSALLLRLRDSYDEFIIKSNAIAKGMEVMLLQKGDPLVFFSRNLGLRMKIASTY